MMSIIKRITYAIVSYIILSVGLYAIVGTWLYALSWAAIGLVVIAYVVNSLREIIVNKVIAQTYKEEMEAIANKMIANVDCSFCGKPNAVRFNANDRNEFECHHCKKPNRLLVNITTAQITVPLTDAITEVKTT